MSGSADVVTFTLASGARVTCKTDLAKRLGWSEPKKPAAKQASK